MRGADDACFAVGEQHRPTVGDGDADGEIRHRRYDRVGARGVGARPRLCGDNRLRRMDLVARHEIAVGDLQPCRHTPPVFGDVRGVVRRALAAIQARVKSLRHATFAREECVADIRKCVERFRLKHHHARLAAASGAVKSRPDGKCRMRQGNHLE